VVDGRDVAYCTECCEMDDVKRPLPYTCARERAYPATGLSGPSSAQQRSLTSIATSDQ
jgi:hypothetical protein